MRKRFQADELCERREGDGQMESSNHLPTFYDKPQPINEEHSPKQRFNADNKEKKSGHGNNQPKILCMEAENGKKSKLPSLLPDVARHFSINDNDDELLLPLNSMVDGYSKIGMDNPVALGPDQGYPKGCETTRGTNSILARPSLNVTSNIQLGKTDQMASNTYMTEATKDNNQNQMREVWTKLYGKTSTREETSFSSTQQLPHSVQILSVGYRKCADNLFQQISTESHTTKSEVPTVNRRPVHGCLQSDKSNAVKNLPSNIIATIQTIPETLKNKQNEEKVQGLKMNYQPSSVTSSDIVFFDVMNNLKYNLEEHNQKGILNRKKFTPSNNKTLFSNFSPVLHNQSKSQFKQNHAYNIEGDQSILDINDSIFDYSATGSISEHSSISTNLPVVPALSSSSSSTHDSKSASPDEKESRLEKAANSLCVSEEKPLHTKMTQPLKKSLWLENRDTRPCANLNVPDKQIPMFSSRYNQQCQKDRCTDDGSMSFDIDDTILTVESIDSDTDQLKIQMPGKINNLHINNMDDIKEQLDNLTFMYQQLFDLMKHTKRSSNDQLRSIANSKTNPLEKAKHYLQRRKSMRSSILETKQNKKHFQCLEAHVVTLVRSVATLTAQVQAHSNTLKQINILKEELQDMKANFSDGNNHIGIPSLNNKFTEYERFRGWIPSLTNPKRVQKLTKFFGQEPPLLEIFLKKLGYEIYISNFSNEHIGMLELPYMTEERLQSIGIPMGPRLRILQESQLCFRQENFNIYII